MGADVTLPEWPKKTWDAYPSERYGVSSWTCLTVARLDEFDAEIAKVAAARHEITSAHEARFQAALAGVVALGFAPMGSRPTGKKDRKGWATFDKVNLDGALRPFMPVPYREAFLAGRRPDTVAERKWLAEQFEAKTKKSREAEDKAKSDAFNTRAVAWLLAKGKVLGTDFTVGNAIDTANEIADEEERARILATTDPMSFDGDDNCEGCDGWVPGHHRCCCGNRRISLSRSDYHSFENPSLYPEAY